MSSGIGAPRESIVALVLAGGAVDGGAAAYGEFFEGGGAVVAELAGAAVDLVLELEEAADAVGVDVVGDGGAAELDGVGEDLLEGGVEADELGAGEAAGVAGGADAGAEEAFVGVDVADAVEDGLVEEGGLDGELTAAEEVGEVGGGDGGGFGAGAGVAGGLGGVGGGFGVKVDDGEAAEAAGVYEAEFAAVGEGQDCVGVGWEWHFGLRDEEAAGHAEVDEKLSVGDGVAVWCRAA